MLKRWLAIFLYALMIPMASPALAEDWQNNWHILMKSGEKFYQQNKLQEAFFSTDTALSIARTNEKPPGLYTVTSLKNYAQVLMDMERYKEAEPILEEYIRLIEPITPPDHIKLITFYNNLAYCQFIQDKPSAETSYLRVLNSYRRTLGEKHKDTIAAALNLAVLYNKQHRYGDAEPLLRDNLAIARQQWSIKDELSIGIAQELLILYLETNQKTEANALKEEILPLIR